MASTEGRVLIAAADLAAIIRRAGQLGIPAWRVMSALGIALPVAQPPGRGGSATGAT